MAAHIRNAEALAMIFSTRDKYVGEFQKPIAAQVIPSKLLSYQPTAHGIFAEIDDRGTRRQLYLNCADHPELMRLGDFDRATLQGALMAMLREVANAA